MRAGATSRIFLIPSHRYRTNPDLGKKSGKGDYQVGLAENSGGTPCHVLMPVYIGIDEARALLAKLLGHRSTRYFG